MLGEVFETFDHFVSEAPYEGQRGIPACGEYLRRVTGVCTGLVLTATDIAHVMKTVLDAPVRA
jgi:hypothetical protein